MNRRAFLAALGLAPFFKWAHRKTQPRYSGWFIAEFKHFPAPPGGVSMDKIIWRRKEIPVDNRKMMVLQVEH